MLEGREEEQEGNQKARKLRRTAERTTEKRIEKITFRETKRVERGMKFNYGSIYSFLYQMHSTQIKLSSTAYCYIYWVFK
jgi:hypothetical protein